MSMTDSDINFMRTSLIAWFEINKRDMPWRESRDPYRIWLSEVMLQQTRVDQATPYYLRFIEAFPSVNDLASADLHDVLMLWEGLGYYTRGRNLHKAAQVVAKQHGSRFPESYEGMLSLPGVGPYTAAAVSSIAFGSPHAVVDGNVIRVISRLSGIEDDVRNQSTKSAIQAIADTLIDPSNPGDFNQAVMELGSLVCIPSKPRCEECPLAPWCVAFKMARTDSIPYKAPKPKVPHYDIVVAIISNNKGELLIARRPENAMLGGLWEFPGGKVNSDETLILALHREIEEELGIDVAIKREFMQLKHAYSHFKITLHAYLCDHLDGEPIPKASTEIRWVGADRLGEFPFPKANRRLTLALMGAKDG
jgi:A/G-specific adenine glycosylase